MTLGTLGARAADPGSDRPFRASPRSAGRLVECIALALASSTVASAQDRPSVVDPRVLDSLDSARERMADGNLDGARADLEATLGQLGKAVAEVPVYEDTFRESLRDLDLQRALEIAEGCVPLHPDDLGARALQLEACRLGEDLEDAIRDRVRTAFGGSFSFLEDDRFAGRLDYQSLEQRFRTKHRDDATIQDVLDVATFGHLVALVDLGWRELGFDVRTPRGRRALAVTALSFLGDWRNAFVHARELDHELEGAGRRKVPWRRRKAGYVDRVQQIVELARWHLGLTETKRAGTPLTAAPRSGSPRADHAPEPQLADVVVTPAAVGAGLSRTSTGASGPPIRAGIVGPAGSGSRSPTTDERIHELQEEQR